MLQKPLSLVIGVGIIFGSLSLPSVHAQQAAVSTLNCTPIVQASTDNFLTSNTRLECRINSTELSHMLVAKYTFPFKISKLVKGSSVYSSIIGILLPSTASDTIAFSSMSLGDANTPMRFQPVPIDQLSFIVETDSKMTDVVKAFAANSSTDMAILTPSLFGFRPVIKKITINQNISFDNSLLVETLALPAEKISLLGFLKFAFNCFEKSAGQCLNNLTQGMQ